jgi:Lon protease-like protein
MDAIPLFPLNTVLFPGAPLDLYIFEERYKRLIRDSQSNDGTFGVSLIREGSEAFGPLPEPHSVGCTAEILEIRPSKKGRMWIRAFGRERFRIQSVLREESYLVGEIEYFPLIDSDPSDLGSAAQTLRPLVLEYLRVLSRLSNEKINLVQVSKEADELAWIGSILLNVPLDVRQALLTLDSASEILNELISLYRHEIPLLRSMEDHRIWAEDPDHLSLN